MKSSLLFSLLLIGSATADIPLYSNNTASTIDNNDNIYSQLGFSVENIHVDPSIPIKTVQYDAHSLVTSLTTEIPQNASSPNTIQNGTTTSVLQPTNVATNLTINMSDSSVASNITAIKYDNSTSISQDKNVYSNITSFSQTTASPYTVSIMSNKTISNSTYPNVTFSSINRAVAYNSSVISLIQVTTTSLKSSNISSTPSWTNNTSSNSTLPHTTSITSSYPSILTNTSLSTNVQFRNSSASAIVTSNTTSALYKQSITRIAYSGNSTDRFDTTSVSQPSSRVTFNPNYANFTLPNKNVNQTATNLLTPTSTTKSSTVQLLNNNSISSTPVLSYNSSTTFIRSSLSTDQTSSFNFVNKTLTFTEENYTTAANYNHTTTTLKINTASVNNTYITQSNRSTIAVSTVTAGAPSSSIQYFTNSTTVNHSSQLIVNNSSSILSITGKNDAAVPTGNIKQPSSVPFNNSTNNNVISTSTSTLGGLTEASLTQTNSTQPSKVRTTTLSTTASPSIGIYRNSSLSQTSKVSTSNGTITIGGNKALGPTSVTLLSFSNISGNGTSTSTSCSSTINVIDPSSSLDANTAIGTLVSSSSVLLISSDITKNNDVEPTGTLTSKSHSFSSNAGSSPIATNLNQTTTMGAASIQTTDGISSKYAPSTVRYDINPTGTVVDEISSSQQALKQASESTNTKLATESSTTIISESSRISGESQKSSMLILTNGQSTTSDERERSSSTTDAASNIITESDISSSTNVATSAKDTKVTKVTTNIASASLDAQTGKVNNTQIITATTSISASHIAKLTDIKGPEQTNSALFSSSSSSDDAENIGTKGSNNVNVNNANPASTIGSEEDRLSATIAITRSIESSIYLSSERITTAVLTGSYTTASTLVRSSATASSTHHTIEYSDSASSMSNNPWFTVIIFILSYVLL